MMSNKICNCVIIFLLSFVSKLFCGHFWHISDLHIDYRYVVGGNISDHCHKSHNNAVNVTDHEMVGPAGNYHCDSPYVLATSALEAMRKIHGDPDFILWTGDSAPHWVTPSGPDMQYIMNVTHKVFRQLEDFFPLVPIIPALGNHDVSPPNQFPISTAENPNPEYYTSIGEHGGWLHHIPEGEGVRTFKKCGYYAKTVQTIQNKTLKFLILNTNIYLNDQFSIGEDPCDQLDWLNQTIAETESTSQLLYIVAHVPPGSYERSPGKIQFNTPKEFAKQIHERYLKIITNKENSNKIFAHLYAHHHSDAFELFLDEETRTAPRGVAFIGSSVSPITGINPSIRLYAFDNIDGSLLDYDQYYLDLEYLNEKFDISKQVREDSKDNKTVNVSSINSVVEKDNLLNIQMDRIKDYINHPSFPNHYTDFLSKRWKLLYKATEAFSIPRLDYMFKAFNNMIESGPNSSMFSDYCQHNTLNHGDRSCGQKVWREMLCTVTNLEEENLASCLNDSDKNGFKGFEPEKIINNSKNSPKPRNAGTNDLDTNDMIIVVSFILFIFIVTILISVLYYRRKTDVEDGEEFLLTDDGFQPDEPFIRTC